MIGERGPQPAAVRGLPHTTTRRGNIDRGRIERINGQTGDATADHVDERRVHSPGTEGKPAPFGDPAAGRGGGQSGSCRGSRKELAGLRVVPLVDRIGQSILRDVSEPVHPLAEEPILPIGARSRLLRGQGPGRGCQHKKARCDPDATTARAMNVCTSHFSS